MLNQIESEFLVFIQENLRFEWLNKVFIFITHFGDGGLFWILLSALLLVMRKTRWVGLTSSVSIGLGALCTNVCLKNLVQRTRPYVVNDQLNVLINFPHDYSFPSGHTCASFAVATVIFCLLPRKYGVPAIIFASLIAISRLYVGVHYPTDILGGLIIGVSAAFIAIYLVKKINHKSNPLRENSSTENM